MRKQRPHKIVRTRGGIRVAFTNTSRIPDKTVVSAIRLLAHHIDLSGVVVHVKSGDGTRSTWGRAYDGIPYIANLDGLNRWEWRYLIVVTDGAFISTLGHEAKHIERFREGIDRKARARHGRRTGMEDACNAFGEWFRQEWIKHREKQKQR